MLVSSTVRFSTARANQATPNSTQPQQRLQYKLSPSEDWTKVSDLVERRRIQNRIAQRNYRKKLKQRLGNIEHPTDFEQRALKLSGSGSGSSMHVSSTNGSVSRSTSSQSRWGNISVVTAQPYAPLPSGDRGMFSERHTSQLSTSSTPFSSALLGTKDARTDCIPHSQLDTDCSMPPMIDIPSDPSYIPLEHRAYAAGIAVLPIKQDLYEEDDFNPFSKSYASINAVDLSTTVHPSHQDIVPA